MILVIIFIQLVLAVLLMFSSVIAMIAEKRIMIFMPFFILGFAFCYGSAFLLTGLIDISLIIIIYLKAFVLIGGVFVIKNAAN